MYPYVDLSRGWMEDAERRASAHRHRRAARAARRARRAEGRGGQPSGTPGRAIDSGGTYDAATSATPIPSATAPLSRSTPR
jgi:hypothetical protein